MHFARLRAWGLTLIRLLIPWESIEHAGPGEYDEAYIDYLRELISIMPEYGLRCFIDPHQDTVCLFIVIDELHELIINIYTSGLDFQVDQVLQGGRFK